MAKPDRSSRRCRGAALALTALALAAHGAAAELCDGTGAPAPDAITLMASTTNPATVAWIVAPDCAVESIDISEMENMLMVEDRNIERVVSVPSDAMGIQIQGNPLSISADFSSATSAIAVLLSGIPTDPAKLTLPATLDTVSFENEGISSIDGVKLPANLQALSIFKTSVTSLKNVRFPDGLTALLVSESKLPTLDFELPPALTSFQADSVSLGALERVSIPSTMLAFTCTGCGITSVRGIKWSSNLAVLDLTDNDISEFEIRQSDLPTFRALDPLVVNGPQTSCSGSGTVEAIGSTKFCVISDEEFEKLYGSTEPDPPGSGSNDDGSSEDSKDSKDSSTDGSKKGSNDTSKNTSKDTSKDTSITVSDDDKGPTTRTSSRPSGGRDADESPLEEDTSGSSNSSLPVGTGRRPRSTPTVAPNSPPRLSSQDVSSSPPTLSENKSSSTGGSSSLVIVILGCALAIAVLAIVCHVFIAKRRRTTKHPLDSPTDNYLVVNTPVTDSDDQAHVDSADSGGDFRDDEELARLRIGRTAIKLGKQLARGGYGVVYRGSYEGRDVAIKQMLPNAWKNDAMVADFVDEIRLCARLDHPKIVAFIGVAWSSVRDVSAVTELMAGGDLYSVLRAHPAPSGREWSEPWTPNQVQPKALIASDVTEAVVYLHSFDSPIIHRDLKAKNVLLDHVGNAKLSDFGISREVSIDETMTSEIGTAAWIAPEVLRGERYGEKADIYSLGVLLVELDRCSHPYANEPLLLAGSTVHADGAGAVGGGQTTHVAHKNTQIVVMVSTGQLRPSASSECPETMAALIHECVSFDASDRPTAKQVLERLATIRNGV